MSSRLSSSAHTLGSRRVQVEQQRSYSWLSPGSGQVKQQRSYSWLSPGSVAAPVIQATGRLRLADRLSSGLLGCSGLCRSGVRTKFGIDMVLLGELGTTRSSKEG